MNIFILEMRLSKENGGSIEWEGGIYSNGEYIMYDILLMIQWVLVTVVQFICRNS